MSTDEIVVIRWTYEGSSMPHGIVGIDSERIPLADLPKWARRTRKRLRRDIRRGAQERERRRNNPPAVGDDRG